MSFKDLVEPECGGANPLMNLGRQVARDVAFQDEGFAGGRSAFIGSGNDLVKEFMGQIAPAPQTFRMDVLLKEMRDIDAQNFHQRQIVPGPPVIEEVNRSDLDWAKEFAMDSSLGPGQRSESKLTSIWSNSHLTPIEGAMNARPSNILYTKDFFDLNEPKSEEEQKSIRQAAGELAEVAYGQDTEKINYSEFLHFINNAAEGTVKIRDGNVWANEFEQLAAGPSKPVAKEETGIAEDWAKAFEDGKKGEQEAAENYNKQFWERLQDEWRTISENESQHPWLSEFSEFYDPYKEYKFDEENPMANVENAFEKGKTFLSKGDIPSAVLCFEAAVKQDPENPEIWELLGFSQAENEKDPNAIAALNKALSFNPNNMPVLMALAVSYTNESMQNQALKMLVKWMKCNPKYEALVPAQMLQSQSSPLASSLLGSPSLQEVQDLFIKAVQKSPTEIDADIQEALGVLFNLSSEYDKAVDCFRAAVQVRPNNSKTWNRLGASLANGNRSVEAVEAYQRALAIQPGFIRARYNVGIICINLKAYKEAAEHLLLALNHQASSIARAGINVSSPANQMSSTIWITLRMVMSLMGRQDLQQAIDNRDLEILNREFPMGTE
ncbi:peroxisomal targeting signal 1 receptor [Toxorhynchites rutilus septentrionalis]|uniref:peroxisomal targeting signal 1 receptor n=1 Tax=Toxorhynchites rutilus septentrionalis TaxID=329112 RepID=UPI00247A8A8D|nr:peroxisomal targeting signal 1 receptor [Toxorhynchites rutilus septentrionalis]